MSKRHLTILLTLMTASLTACGAPKEKKRSATAPVQKIFLHGDPRELIKGTQLNSESFLRTGHAADFDGFESTMYYFVQSSPTVAAETTQEDLEEENAAPTSKDTTIAPTYTMSQLSPGRYSYAPSDAGSDNALPSLGFETMGDILLLTTLNSSPVEVLHYSVRPDKRAMSFLLMFDDDPKYGDVLIAVYFHKPGNAEAAPSDVDKTYNYLLGEGVSTAWREPIEVSVCGGFDPREERAVRSAIEAWPQHGKIGQVELKVKTNVASAPFSDVNENCVMMVDAYSVEVRSDAAVLGLAMPVVDSFEQRILAADVFLFRQGFDKIYGSNLLETDIFATAAHEIGHFLGLDHEFDAGIESIMSYDDVTEVKAHDRAAIEAAYARTAAR